MKKREPVSYIMTENVFTVSPHHALHEAKQILDNHHISHIPVVYGDQIVGILSKSDVTKMSFQGIYENQEETEKSLLKSLTVRQVMTANPRTVSPQTSIREAAEILVESEFHALPVTEGTKLVGIVTSTDVMKYLVEQY